MQTLDTDILILGAGGAVCGACRQPGAATPTPLTFDLMVALLRGDWDLADASEPRQRVECSGLVAASEAVYRLLRFLCFFFLEVTMTRSCICTGCSAQKKR